MNIPFDCPYGLSYKQAVEVFRYVEKYFAMEDVEREISFMQLEKYDKLSEEEKLEAISRIAEYYTDVVDESGVWNTFCTDSIDDWKRGEFD